MNTNCIVHRQRIPCKHAVQRCLVVEARKHCAAVFGFLAHTHELAVSWQHGIREWATRQHVMLLPRCSQPQCAFLQRTCTAQHSKPALGPCLCLGGNMAMHDPWTKCAMHHVCSRQTLAAWREAAKIVPYKATGHTTCKPML